MSDLIERLRDKARLRAAHGLTGWVLAEEALLAQAADEIERLTAALRHEADCVDAAKAEIERLTAERDALRDDNVKLNGWMEDEAQAAGRLQRKLNAAEEEIERLRQWEMCGLEWQNKTDWVQQRMNSGDWPVTALGKHRADVMREEIERLTDENGRLRADLLAGRNVVNAGLTIHTLTAERDELRRQLDPMGEYASADELIATLHAEKAEDDAMKLDARRYRDWLRGGANIPPESTRWAGWEVRYWNGRHWITLFAEQMDTAIDAAMGLTRPAEES